MLDTVRARIRRARPLIPLFAYPVLAIGRRWIARRTVRLMERQDALAGSRLAGTTVPRASLRMRVTGECTGEAFLASGHRTLSDFERALGLVRRSLSDCSAVLDFGCGCGRTVQALAHSASHIAIHGTDIDAEAIHWCREHLPFATFHVNDRHPPLPCADEMFDVIWSVSVFTHPDEQDQFAWLAELRRLLKPGGVLLASVHGPSCQATLPRSLRKRLARRGFAYARFNGETDWFPDWYQVAWHSERYIRDEWSRFLRVEQYLPQGVESYQDLVVATKSV